MNPLVAERIPEICGDHAGKSNHFLQPTFYTSSSQRRDVMSKLR
jgi:hypothetical protein